MSGCATLTRSSAHSEISAMVHPPRASTLRSGSRLSPTSREPTKSKHSPAAFKRLWSGRRYPTQFAAGISGDSPIVMESPIGMIRTTREGCAGARVWAATGVELNMRAADSTSATHMIAERRIAGGLCIKCIHAATGRKDVPAL